MLATVLRYRRDLGRSPTVEELARDLEATPSAVRHHLTDLSALGLVLRQGSPGRGADLDVTSRGALAAECRPWQSWELVKIARWALRVV